MRIGDYVRTADGQLGQIKLLDKRSGAALIDYKYHTCNEDTYNITGIDKDILNLLQPMDLLYIDISPDEWGGIIVPRIPETVDELNKYKQKIRSGEYILKGIVTSEKLRENEYIDFIFEGLN